MTEEKESIQETEQTLNRKARNSKKLAIIFLGVLILTFIILATMFSLTS